MKKMLTSIAVFVFWIGCGQAQADQPLRVVTSIFPQFDFVRQIAGDRVELAMLLSPGAESHSFEPTPRDIITLNAADLFIYVYRGSEVWVHPILASLEREDLHTMALVSLVETVEQEVVEGMEAHHHHTHGHAHEHGHHHTRDHTHGHSHHHDLDEHVWTSPRNAILIVHGLTQALAQLDPYNAEFFRANAEAYIRELEVLDQLFGDVVAGGARRTIVVGDRFPFRYLIDAYGLSYFAAFAGCATDTQASPATIAFLIDKINEENIPVVFHIEFSCQQIANVIAEETGARILELHSAHNLSHTDFSAGVTYIDLMTRNAQKLREALH